MAKTKSELLAQASELGLKLTEKNTVAEITEALKQAQSDNSAKVAEKANQPDDDSSAEIVENEEHFAKAGKRSEKAVKAANEEADRQARKEAGDTTPQGDAPAQMQKGPAPKTRPLAERKSKAYKKVATNIDRAKLYSLAEAMELATKTAVTKFDSTVELHVRLGVDPKQADQNIRSTVALPNGTGKTVIVAALVGEDDAASAKEAGADFVGEADIIKMLDKENIAFDVLVATPQLMPKLGKYARLLGPRGLMPNPKAGTVSANPAKAVKETKSGKVEFRVDKQGIVHLGIGKVSFGAKKLVENATTFMSTLKSLRPSTIKGSYIISVSVATTMGPSIHVNID